MSEHSREPLVDRACAVEAGNLDREDLLEQLRSERYPDQPDRRLEAIVDGALDRVAARREVPLTTQPRTTDETVPAGPIRRLTAADVAEVSDREFGRLFGLALRQFCDDVEVETAKLREDVTTVAWSDADGPAVAVVVTRRRGGTLSERQVEGIAEMLAMGASADQRLALVTNAEVDTDAAAYAAEYEVSVCDRQHLDGILSLARLPPEAYGEALESGENTTFDWEALTGRLPEPPMPLDEVDPLDAAAIRDRSALGIADADPATGKQTANDTETSSGVSWQSDGRSQGERSGAGDATPEADAEDTSSTGGWEVDESEVVAVDEERLGELHTTDSSDTDEAIGGLIENLEDSS